MLDTQLGLFSGAALQPQRSWPFGSLAPFQADLIMIDPPWPWQAYSPKGLGKSPEAHYQTMTIAEICALPVAELAARDCLLWLWARAQIGRAFV